MNGSLMLGSRRVGSAAIASARETSSVEQPAMIVRPGPRCSIALMPAREARRDVDAGGQVPGHRDAQLPGLRHGREEDLRRDQGDLDEVGARLGLSPDGGDGVGMLPAFSGVSRSPGSASTSGESSSSGSVPADRSASSRREPLIWRNPVTPLAEHELQVADRVLLSERVRVHVEEARDQVLARPVDDLGSVGARPPPPGRPS